ncbi:Molybdenum cofactor synthesis protein 1 [Entophlyctis sp. JEL0112]|nr:Molybdenum cofactor synthesis protein 1 [Entophlyctis sp. JEL0112]
MKGVNDHEVAKFVDLTKTNDIYVRFIEYMPFDGNQWTSTKFVPYKEILSNIIKVLPVSKCADSISDTSKAYRVEGYKGKFGFITSMSEHFCHTCNRIRLLADGNLKVCLFGNTEVNLLELLRAGASDDELVRVISDAVVKKKERHAGMDIKEVTAIAYGIAYKLGVIGTLKLILFMGFVDFLLVGAAVATVFWLLANTFLIQHQIHSAEQSVEWAYCFDVHCNSFFPVFLITYVLQFFFIPLVTREGWIAVFLGNTIYMAAIGYYFYVTHLGYNVLPFLRRVEVFLWPVSLVVVLYIVSLVVWFNVSKRVLGAYFG